MPLTKFVVAPLSSVPKLPTTSSSPISWYQLSVLTRPNLKASNFITGKALTKHHPLSRFSQPLTTAIFFKTREPTSDLKTKVSLSNSFSRQHTHISCQVTWTFFNGPSLRLSNAYSKSWTNSFSPQTRISNPITPRSRSTTSLYKINLLTNLKSLLLLPSKTAS